MEVILYSPACYNKNMPNLKPTSIKFEDEDLEEYQAMAKSLGFPFSVFVKMVLRQYADMVYYANKGANMTKISKNLDKSY